MHEQLVIRVLCEKVEALESQVKEYGFLIDEAVHILMPDTPVERELFDRMEQAYKKYN